MARARPGASNSERFFGLLTSFQRRLEALERRASLPSGTAWTAYTPSLTNISLGNGSLEFVFLRIGPEVRVRGEVTFGSTTSISGAPQFTLPGGDSMASPNENILPLGQGALLDSGSTTYHVIVARSTISTVRLVRYFTAGNDAIFNPSIGATVPFTWGAGDEIHMNFAYEPA